MTDSPNEVDICLKTPEKQIESKEFTLNKESLKYNIKIGKTRDKIILSSLNYEAKFNLDDLIKTSKLFNICKSIDEVYEFIVNLFGRKKVIIKEINDNKLLKLNLSIYNNIKCSEEKIEMSLNYNKNDKYSIINEVYHRCNNIQNSLNKVQEENKEIKKQLKYVLEEISNLKNENEKLKK